MYDITTLGGGGGADVNAQKIMIDPYIKIIRNISDPNWLAFLKFLLYLIGLDKQNFLA